MGKSTHIYKNQILRKSCLVHHKSQSPETTCSYVALSEREKHEGGVRFEDSVDGVKDEDTNRGGWMDF